jgi:hypothetical protein
MSQATVAAAWVTGDAVLNLKQLFKVNTPEHQPVAVAANRQ